LILFAFTGMAASAQTNTPALFQGYPPGAIVQVRSDNPVVILSRATLKEIAKSNVVVVANGERFVLDKSSTVLSDLPGSSAPMSAPVPVATGNNAAPSAPATFKSPTQADVQQMVQGKYANDPGYATAMAQYQSMMNDFNSGKISLADMTAQAQKVLAKADEYKPERAKDPQYEEQIAALRDFVKRAQAGETLTRQAPTVPPNQP
jgi:hypothetical protein